MTEKRIRLAIVVASNVFSGYFVLGALVLAGLQLNTDRFAITVIVGLFSAVLGYLLGAGMQKRNRIAATAGLLLAVLLLLSVIKSPASSADGAALVAAGLLVLVTGWGTIAVFSHHRNKRLAFTRRSR